MNCNVNSENEDIPEPQPADPDAQAPARCRLRFRLKSYMAYHQGAARRRAKLKILQYSTFGVCFARKGFVEAVFD